ncbi:hypothetical protein EC991_001262 [Linnemannia zychae]|nr:hypothetical protein EC991_001262 [Linnemannia zychae]
MVLRLIIFPCIYDQNIETYNIHDAYDNCSEYDYYEPDDTYDDYDDVYLAPPLLHKPKSKRNSKIPKPKTFKKQPAQTKIIQPLLDTSTPPELPLEILEFVCTHLSKTTLLYGVNRVCKKWHEVSNRFIRRAGIWKPIDGVLEPLFQQWPKLNTLELWFNQDPEISTNHVSITKNTSSWYSFVEEITKLAPVSQEAQQNSNHTTTANTDNCLNTTSDSAESLPLLHSIRDLELRGKSITYSEIFSKLHGHLQFVESLTITVSTYRAIYPLFTILDDFPSLKRLTLTINYGLRNRLTHGDNDDLIGDVAEPPVNPETAHFPRKPWVIPPPKMFPNRYRLQEFNVEGVITHLRVLERLLVTCPDLRVFIAARNEINMLIRESGPNAEHNARQRLIHLAAKHCPKLEWYNFRRLEYVATDGSHLEDIVSAFPEHKILSMNFGGYQDTMPSTYAARHLLSRITVLDVQMYYSIGVDSATMNRILCLTPNLLHLFARKTYFLTSRLWKPPAPVQPTPKPVFHTIRDRKRYEREERRQARQQALARFHPSASTGITEGDQADESNTSASIFSTPETWQLYKLKTLEMTLHNVDNVDSSFVEFTSYISQHRLFRNLVVFNILIPTLKVGQREKFSDLKKPSSSATIPGTSISSNAPDGGKRHATVVTPVLEPARFPNELLALSALRCLEECILRTPDVPGMVLAKDFEFLRRKDDFQTMSFLPKRPKSSILPSTTTTINSISTHQSSSTRRNKMTKNRSSSLSEGGDGNGSEDDDDTDDDDDEEHEARLKTETFWPKLNTFHVYYYKISPIISTSKIVAGLEEIRPGVSFCFKYRNVLDNQ